MGIKTGLLDFSKLLTLDDFIALMIIGILSFFGSVGKDYLAMFSYHRRMNPIRITLSTVTSLLVIFGVSDVILEYTGVKGLMLASFLCGLVGFELLQRISTLKGIFGLLERLWKLQDLFKKMIILLKIKIKKIKKMTLVRNRVLYSVLSLCHIR